MSANVDLIAVADLIGQKGSTVEAVARAIGEIRERGEDRWYLKSRDDRFTKAIVFFKAVPGGEPVVQSVVLETGEPSRLLTKDVATSFGKYETLPAFPDGPVNVIGFERDQRGNDFTVDVTATLSEGPDKPTSGVNRLTIRRGFPRN